MSAHERLVSALVVLLALLRQQHFMASLAAIFNMKRSLLFITVCSTLFTQRISSLSNVMKIKEIFVHVSTTNHSEFSLFCKHTNDEKENCDVKNEDGSS